MPEFHFLHDSGDPTRFPAGALEGNHFADLYADYFGLKESGQRVDKYITVNFRHQLAHLWQRKLGVAPQDGVPDDMLREALLTAYRLQPQLFELAERLYTSYDPLRARCNVREYEERVAHAVAPLRAGVEQTLSEKAATVMRLSHEQAALVHECAGRLDAKALTAYSLTELMPGKDGPTNVHALDFLLQNAGEGFIERIPAIHDALISFGPYQLTPLALDRAQNAGASALDAILPHQYLPATVADLRGEQHHQAAYLFAIHNVIQLARELDAKSVQEARLRLAHAPLDLLAFVAISHNKPSEGRRAFTSLLHSLEGRALRIGTVDTMLEKTQREMHARISQERLREDERHIAHLRHERQELEARAPSFLSNIRDTASREYAQKTLANFSAL